MINKTKVNIFELARQNADHLKQQFQESKKNCKKEKADRMDEFAAVVQNDWKLSINMRDWALYGFFATGKYMNIYEHKEKQADELITVGTLDAADKKRSLKKALEKHLNEFYKRRRTFDSNIIDGDKLKYAALNIGGVGGVNRFNRYCVVIKREEAEGYDTLAFIKEDSLLNYIENESKLALAKLARDVSDKDCVPILAALKHGDDIERLPREEWPVMVCNDSCFIEAVTKDNISNDHIHCIRIEKSYHDKIFLDALLKSYYSELPEEEQYRLVFSKHLFAEIEKRRIELEIVDGNEH